MIHLLSFYYNSFLSDEAKSREALNQLLQSDASADLVKIISHYFHDSRQRIKALEAEMARSKNQISSVQSSLTTKINTVNTKISALQTELHSVKKSTLSKRILQRWIQNA